MNKKLQIPYWIWKIMKVSVHQLVILFVWCGISYANSSSGQNILEKSISLHAESLRFKNLLMQIEEQAHVRFIYSSSTIDTRQKVSFRAQDKKLELVLKELLYPLSIDYSVVENRILLKSFATKQEDGNVIFPTVNDRSGSSVDEIIKGKVTDENGASLPGVNILVKGTQRGIVTDADGKFSIEVPDENAILVFSFVGYVSQEILVGSRANLEVSLKVDEKALEEVVVVGYGTQKKVNMTGAVDVISNEQIGNRQAATVSQILQGQSPGLNFSVGNAGFEPGASMNINIRGMGSLNGGSPFVLIDGFPGEMDRLNPNDIQSISILKDAAASAIYGARAPYGVILITTKSGKKNEKLSVSYSGNVSMNTPDRLPEMLDSYTFARVVNEMGDNAGGRPYSQAAIRRIIAYQNKDWDYLKQFMPADATHYEAMVLANGRWGHNHDNHANYDWYDEFYGKSWNQQHNLSVTGGSDKTSYYLSSGFVGQEGVLNYGTDYYNRYNLLGKINTSVTNWWDIRFETRLMRNVREKFLSNQDTTDGYELMFRQVTRTVPSQAKYDGYGNYANQSKIPFIEDGGTDKIETTENWHIMAMDFKPLPGWKITGDFAYRSTGIDQSTRYLTVYEPYADGRVLPVAHNPSRIVQTQGNHLYWASNIYSTYDFSLFKKHHIQAMLGMQYEYNKEHLMTASKTNLIVREVPSLETANGDATVSENLFNWATKGYFGRFTYNYDEKYLFEINTRYDGTSRFKSGNRWGFFPSFSAGWNIDREKFWQGASKHVSTFKIRGSWGQLGNQQVSPYQDLSLIPLETGRLNWIYNYGESRPTGYTSTPALVSPNLTWETATTKNLGLNLGFLDNRLQLDVDLFERITKEMIGPSEPVPGVLGASVPRSNNATLRSRGWEASVRWNQKLPDSDFAYFVNLNAFDAQSTVLKYLNPTGLVSNWYEGKDAGEIWGYTANGLFKSREELDSYLQNVNMSFISNSWNPGDVKYEDLNGDGRVNIGSNTVDNHGDLSIIGNNTPRYQVGFSGGFSYKGLDLSFLIKGTLKRDYFVPTGNNQIRFWGMSEWLFTGLTPAHLDYFRDKPGDEFTGLYEGDANINLDSYWPKVYMNAAQNAKNRQTSTRYLQDASYIRLQNVRLGYNLPQPILAKMRFKTLRVFLSGENLLTLTKLLKGIDPVALIGFGDGVGNSYGADKIFSLGFNASL